MATDLLNVLEAVVADVNFIKPRPLNSRYIAKQCTDDWQLFHSHAGTFSGASVKTEYLKAYKPELALFISYHMETDKNQPTLQAFLVFSMD